MLPFIGQQKLAPVSLRLWLRRGPGLNQRRSCVNVEQPIVGMIFTEPASQPDVVPAAVKDLKEDHQSIEKLCTGELGAEPGDKRVYILPGWGPVRLCP